MPTPSAESVYLFRHALLRDAAYQLQLPGERAKLHRLAFELLLQIIPPEAFDAAAAEIAEHARLSGDLPPDLQRAELNALVRAESYIDGRLPAQATLPLADRILAHPLADATLRHRISARKALALGNMGRIEEAAAIHAQCIGTSRAEGSAALPDLLISASMLAMRTGQEEQAGALLEEVLKLVPPGDASRARTRGNALGNLGVLLLEQGRPQEARQRLEEAAELSQGAGDTRSAALTALNLANARNALGEGDPEREFADAMRLCQSVRSRAGEMNARSSLCALRLSAGDLGAALDHANRIQELARETGLVRYEVIALLELARIRWRSGDAGSAGPLARQALVLCGAMRSPVLTASTRAELAFLRRLAGDEAGAAEEWRAVQRVLDISSGATAPLRARLDDDCDRAGVKRFDPDPTVHPGP